MMLDALIAPVSVVPPGEPLVDAALEPPPERTAAPLPVPETVLRLPGDGRLFLARLIDLGLVAAILAIGSVLGWFGPSWEQPLPADPFALVEALSTRPLALLGVAWLSLHVVGGALAAAIVGATPGARITGLRLVRRASGARIGPARALIRAILSGLSLVLGGIGYAWSLVDGHRRTLHDVLTGTLLVRRGSSIEG